VFRILSSQAIEGLIERTRTDDLRHYRARLVVENERAAAVVCCELCSKISFHGASVPNSNAGGHFVPPACPYETKKRITGPYEPTSKSTADLRLFT
jgi:hypothetical protein